MHVKIIYICMFAYSLYRNRKQVHSHIFQFQAVKVMGIYHTLSYCEYSFVVLCQFDVVILFSLW